MKNLIPFFFAGAFFGIVLSKSEITSWYRIQEMFHFQSIHVFAVMLSAVPIGILAIKLSNKFGIKDISAAPIQIKPKVGGYRQRVFGGLLFGLGWGLHGACPGPMYTLLGQGMMIYGVLLLSALAGTLAYGAWRHRLPH